MTKIFYFITLLTMTIIPLRGMETLKTEHKTSNPKTIKSTNCKKLIENFYTTNSDINEFNARKTVEDLTQRKLSEEDTFVVTWEKNNETNKNYISEFSIKEISKDCTSVYNTQGIIDHHHKKHKSINKTLDYIINSITNKTNDIETIESLMNTTFISYLEKYKDFICLKKLTTLFDTATKKGNMHINYVVMKNINFVPFSSFMKFNNKYNKNDASRKKINDHISCKALNFKCEASVQLGFCPKDTDFTISEEKNKFNFKKSVLFDNNDDKYPHRNKKLIYCYIFHPQFTKTPTSIPKPQTS